MENHGSKLMWKPTQTEVQNSELNRFVNYLKNQGVSLELNDHLIHQWSVQSAQNFWSYFWDFAGIIGSKGQRVLVDGDQMLKARWFPDAKLNYAENLLRQSHNEIALSFWGEDQVQLKMTRLEIREQVRKLQKFLKDLGVGPGDRVVGFVPNRPEVLVAMLATASLGAVWSSCSSDFGIQGVLDRFNQIAPKVLFAGDGYFYNGKWIDCTGKITAIQSEIKSLKATVVIPYNENKKLDSCMSWSDCMKETDHILEFTRVDFSAPLFIMYSSGTTGLPKCIVHSVGGTLIQHMKEHMLHCDLRDGTKIFYYTTCGWMMWNWLVSALAVGSQICLYDGSPFYPDAHILWNYLDKEGIEVFGTSAKYIQALEKSGAIPRQSHRLDSLKSILSTGSPLLPEGFDYIYRDIKNNLRVSSISGGTDIISCFALGSPTLPVYRSELQCKGLGMAVAVFNDEGKSVVQQKGELVCTQSFPSQPVGFWNDPQGEKYQKSYFSRFPNIWCHGDFAEITEHQGLVIYGRSDTVLNPGGVRIGTAEIYRVVENQSEILEALAVGQDWKGDERIVLFVRLKEGKVLTEDLVKKIKKSIRNELSPRHVPAKILAVNDIPRTISGKISELAVRNVIHRQEVKNKDALANPKALDLFVNLAELQTDES